MRIIKEYCAGEVRTYICIRFKGYGHSFKAISELVALAKQDFPSVLDESINIQQYGGDTFKRTFGIEFPISDGDPIPESYESIKQMHLVL